MQLNAVPSEARNNCVQTTSAMHLMAVRPGNNYFYQHLWRVNWRY